MDNIPLEYSGKLMEAYLNKLESKNPIDFCQNANVKMYELVNAILNLRENYLFNLNLTGDTRRDNIPIVKGVIYDINQKIQITFEKWILLLQRYNIDTDYFIHIFNEFLENLNFKEAYGSNTNPIFSLENYSKHIINTEGLFFHKGIPAFDFLRILKNIKEPDHLKENELYQYQGFTRYSVEFLDVLDRQFIDCLVSINKLINLQANAIKIDPQKFKADRDQSLINISLELFIIYNLANVDETYFCKNFKND